MDMNPSNQEETLLINQIAAISDLNTLKEVVDNKMSDDYEGSEQVILQTQMESAIRTLGIRRELGKRHSLESLSSRPSVTSEGLTDAISMGVSALGKRIAATFKDTVDKFEYFSTAFQLQSDRLDDLRFQVDGIPDGEYSISLSGTKYVRYGVNQIVDSLSAYVHTYEEAMGVMKKVNEEMGECLSGDFGAFMKTLVSPVSGYDKNYMELYHRLENLVLTVKDATKAVSYTQNEDYLKYRSKTYLGLSHFEFKTPLTQYIKPADVDIAKKNHKHYTMSIWRENKFESNLTNGRLEWDDVNKSSIEKLVHITYGAIGSYHGMNTMKAKLSTLGSHIQVLEGITTAVLPGKQVLAILSAYRLLVRLSNVIANTVPGLFNFTRGNIDKCLEIMDKAGDIRENISNEKRKITVEAYFN